jgi:hypothetical protein
MALPERLAALLGGPGRFRFILQPIVAILLGIRDGRLDAKAGRRAYLISVFFVREGRWEALKSGIKTFNKPFVVSVILDIIVQFYLFRNVRLWSALVVGTLLIALPYSLARGLTNRIIRWRGRRRGK